jgi:hypothetical protein
MEYSVVVTADTVCVSRTLPGLPPFRVFNSERWYVNVKGGSPISVNLISAWSPSDSKLEILRDRRVGRHRFTFVDVLEDPIPLADLRAGQWMDRITQVCHHRFTHLLLLRDGCYLEFARLLLSKCER